ncbi:ABC transporter substrate-binding protein [Salinibius halmophilus]|uniref:ABC transporter substrate-binding protein n=1 Tax=Salinibius halmophilus TaxID=1853216 RepID=UPI000E65F67F|nr:ABC transporter substrate-binding protein [Salinibius halmophilus]
MRWLILLFITSFASANHWQIMVNADFTTGGKQGGEAILAGAQIAVAEINAAGGVLGKPIELVVRDHRANPARGILHVEQASEMPNLLAILGGIHTPVVLAELETIHQKDLIYLVPWAAGTPIIDNGYNPNNVFRLSLRDEWVGEFLVKEAQDLGCQHTHSMLENTGWGRSNEKALLQASQELGFPLLPAAWFNWQTELFPQLIDGIYEHGETDCLFFVGNARDAVNFANALIAGGEQPAVLSHWGVVADDFVGHLGLDQLQRISFKWVNTVSSGQAKTAVGEELLAQYQRQYGSPNNSYNGVVQAYDLVHLLTKAVALAGDIQASAIRDALRQIESHQGAMKTYSWPFRDSNEALAPEDLLLLQANDNGIGVPF